MSQLICSTHKMGDKIVVFDSSDSFTPDTLKRNLTDEYVEENVKFMGRNYCDDNDVTWLVQSGSAVEFNVSAQSAEVTIYGDDNINNDEKYRPRYAVIVDGEIILDEVMSEKEKTVELFSGKENRTAEVKIIHLSEANNGTVGVGNIKVNSTSSIPVSPLPEKDLLIEFVGDSITCAYGVEGASAYENFKTSTENFMKSYAYLTAQKLNADYSAVSYSGHGIVSGYSQDGSINTESLVPPVYDKIGKIKPYDVEWNFKRKPDVIVINLGTNDDTYVSKDFEKRSQEYTDAYTDFLGDIFSKSPDSYIICTVGTMGCQEMYPCIEDAVKNFKEKYHLPFTLLSDPEVKVIDAYGVWQEKKMYGRTYMGIVRSTYLIDEEGIIVKAFEKVKAKDNPEQMLEVL